MRKRHWLSKLLSGALCAVLPTAAWAQGPDQGYPPYIDPNSPQAAAYAPAYTGYEQAGFPPGATQWPYISPHMAPPVDQHSYQDGFWFRDQKTGGREYFTYLGATFNRYAPPDDVTVGDPNAPGDFQTGTVTGGQTQAAQIRIFRPYTWRDVDERITSGGFRGMTGWFNADDTGFVLDGFWAEEGRASFTAWRAPVDFNNTAEIERRAVDILRAYAGVGLFDGGDSTILPPVPPNTTGVEVPGGGTQPYDMFYKLGWQSQSYGAGLGYYMNPMYSTGSFKMRPVLGLRYLLVRENATFEGVDSGLVYTVNTSTFQPVVGSVIGPADVFHSYLRSNTKSQLAGPEIGFRFDLGNDKFKIWAHSKVGVLANHSERELEGFGIGRSAVAVTAAPPTPNDPALTSFRQQETTTHVSPTFEQSIFVRAPLLQFVPGVRKIRLFEEAQFQAGYTWMIAGAMYRPGNVVDWRGYPNFPSLNSEKTSFYVQSVNFGVEWEY